MMGVMRRVNLNKVAGPNGVTEWELKDCVDQLARAYRAIIPSCLKLSAESH